MNAKYKTTTAKMLLRIFFASGPGHKLAGQPSPGDLRAERMVSQVEAGEDYRWVLTFEAAGAMDGDQSGQTRPGSHPDAGTSRIGLFGRGL